MLFFAFPRSLPAGIFLLLGAVPGHAQDAALPAVDITAHIPAARPEGQVARFDVPASASVLDGNDIEAAHQDTLADVARQLPGMSMSGYTRGTPIIMIRGLGIDADESDSSAVPVLLDGVPVPSLAVGQLFDLERVEVLRGPQMLRGPGAIGGMVLLQSRAPQTVAGGELALEGGRYGQRRAVLRGDVPLHPGSALRLAAGGERSDGPIHNTALERRDTANWRNRFARLQWLHHDAGGGQWRIGLYETQSKGGNDWFAPSELARQHRSEAGDAGSNRTGLRLLTARQQRSVGDSAQLSVILGSSRAQWNYWMPESLLPGRTGFDQVTRQHSAEVRLEGQRGALDWLLGGFAQHARRDAPYLFDLRPYWFSRTRAARRGSTLATFGELGWRMARNWRLAGALRLEHTRQRLAWQGELGGLVDTDGDGVPDAPFASNERVPHAHFRHNAFLPRATLEYRPDGQHFGWMGLAKGHEPAGFNTYATAQEQARQPYRAASARHLELGWRMRAPEDALGQSAWQIEASAFHTTLRQQQHVQPVLGQTVTTNVPRSHSRGMEFSGQWQVARPLVLRAFLGWTDAKFDEYEVGGVDWAGEAFAMTPRHSAGAALLWQPTAQWVAQLALARRSESNLFPNSRARSPAHTVLDAHVSWRRQQWSLGVWGKNLGNARYLTRALANDLVVAGQPRTLGVRVGLEF